MPSTSGAFLYGQLSPVSLRTLKPAGGAVDARYVEGKGKAGVVIPFFPFERTIANFDFNVRNYYPDTLFYPTVNWRLYGAYNFLHTIESFLGPEDNLTRMPDLEFRNYSGSFSRYEITPESGIGFPQQDGKFRIRFTASTSPGTGSYYHFALGRLVYPQRFDVLIPEEGKQFNLIANDSLPAVNITLKNPPFNPKVYDLTDYANVQELGFAQNTAGELRLNVPNNGVARKLWVVSDTTNYAVTDAEPVKWLDISELDPSRYDYLIVTHDSLFNSATRYKNYRESAEGGGHNVLLVTIDALYNTFTFGETNPLAVRRFVEFMYANGEPEFLFLLGGGLRFDMSSYIDFDRSGREYQNLIPPYGVPSCDNLYTAGLAPSQNALVPTIPVGRLSAMTNEQVNNYLNKVIEYETDPSSQTWRKNILQLSGGVSAQENATFRRYAEGFGRKAEGDFLGANVKTISKKTTDFVEFINIADEINEGTLLLTFFGHAGISVTDIEIGRIGDPNIGYANKGRYPLILVNGCGTGDPFQANPSALAENWMLAKDAGAIAFLAHAGIGFSGTLRNYTDIFYETAFTDRQFINKTLGEVYNETIRRCLRRNPDNPLTIANVQQMLLQGDPAIRLVPFEHPDYQATAADVSFLPFDPLLETIANPDSFNIAINVSNLGIVDVSRRDFRLSVRRVFEDGTSVTYPSRSYDYIQKERELRFPVITTEENRERNQGQNFFEITIDSQNEVEESNERNNVVTLNFTFGDRPLLTLFPSEYSIVNSPSSEITLIAQDPNADFEFGQYIFQMDTTALFNSPVLREQMLTRNEQIISWRTNLSVPTDETVHYWRVRRVTEEADTVWSEASFVYAPTSNEGWNQSHPFQFRESELNTISLNTPTRAWEFDAYARNIGFSASVASGNEFDYKITVDEVTIVENNCGRVNDAIVVTVFDQFSGQIVRSQTGNECGNSLSSASLVRGDLTPYFDAIETGDWVLLASFISLSGSGRRVFVDAAQQIGADPALLNANLRRRAVVIGQKGAAPGTAIMVFEDSDDRNIISDSTVQISGFYNTGEIISTRIGPAVNWKKLTRTIQGADNENKGWELDILVEFDNGSRSVLLEDVQEETTDLSAISTLGADFLRLRLRTQDKINEVPDPNQLKKWRVTYTEVPEGILLYDSASYRPNTVLEVQEGAPVVLAFEFENISSSDFTEPLQVSYEIQNLSSGTVTNLRDTLTALSGNAKLRFETSFNSVDFFGENQVLVTVNPRLQLEQRYDNNTLTARFVVKPDDINPVLDVAFDGKHILNGDLVAPSPLISISLQDENRVQVRQDTTGIDLLLKPADCDGCIAERINFSDPRLTWQVTENNRIEITYQPDPLADGLYNFTVRAADLRGNQSGVQPYSVNFEVVNESAITHFYPHPNPFSSQMQFVFTLTGQTVPEDIRIQIMTISGKLVKTIHKEDLGPLRIGDNITDFAWDGTDEFGDQLANGVYLYKVSIRDNSTDFEHRETSNDGLFKQNIGKIYLMR